MPSNAKVAVKPCPMPGCGGKCIHTSCRENVLHQVWCSRCGYTARSFRTEAEAVAAHNRVALAVELHGELVAMLERTRTRLGEDGFLREDVEGLLARAAQSPAVEAEGGSDE